MISNHTPCRYGSLNSDPNDPADPALQEKINRTIVQVGGQGHHPSFVPHHYPGGGPDGAVILVYRTIIQVGAGVITTNMAACTRDFQRTLGTQATTPPTPLAPPTCAAQVSLFVGTLLLGGGLLQLGFFTNLMSNSVISGYLAGAALIVIMSQARAQRSMAGDRLCRAPGTSHMQLSIAPYPGLPFTQLDVPNHHPTWSSPHRPTSPRSPHS